MKVTIQLNGESYSIEEGIRLNALIEQLQMLPMRIAVEINQQVVPKAKYADTVLNPGDKVEIINFVGGG
jgi:sulfur carrier protein